MRLARGHNPTTTDMITEIRFSAVATRGRRPRVASISLRSRVVPQPVGARPPGATRYSPHLLLCNYLFSIQTLFTASFFNLLLIFFFFTPSFFRFPTLSKIITICCSSPEHGEVVT